MNLQKASFAGIQQFLDSIPRQIMKRGRQYFENGNVTALECIEPDFLYGAVVRGGTEYDVEIEFSKFGLNGICTCPMEFDCKHIVAAILALRDEAEEKGSCEEPGGRRNGVNSPAVPQPPASAFQRKVAEHLGRKLRSDESSFVRLVQDLYYAAKARPIMEEDVCLFGGTQQREYYGNPHGLELWPAFPANDFLFWLYIAWELRHRQIEIPAFLKDITDFKPIEEDIQRWERQKEITRWKTWFQSFEAEPPQSEPGVLELRLVVSTEEARLQWRINPNDPFLELKQSHAKQFGEQFNAGSLPIASNSLPIWSAVYKPWTYENWWSFKYASTAARGSLSRLLRLPLAPECVVNPDGQPLARIAEPLCLKLGQHQDGDHDYTLELTMADGSAPPRHLCILEGRPALYLTEHCLFEGPSADALSTASRKNIPREAIETADGLRFLHGIGVPMPGHLEGRIRKVAVKVTISCKLEKSYAESRSENIVISISAKAAGIDEQKFTPHGWDVASNSRSRKSSKLQNEEIVIHDRAAQKHFPRILNPLGVKWGGYPEGWKLKLNKKTPEILVEWFKSLPPELEVLLDKQLATLRDEPVSGSVSLDIAEAGIDWFDLKVALDVGDTTLTQDELRLLLNARGGFVRLGSKGWRRLEFNLSPEEDEQLARLGLNPRDFTAEPQRFHALQLADDAAKKFLGPERVEMIQRRASELKARVMPPMPRSIQAELRPYQTEGFHFLAYLAANRFGGVLADDMGLGKTLQTLTWLAWMRESAGQNNKATLNPSLVVCPKSVTDNWRAEAERFYPHLRVRLWRNEAASELPAAREEADLMVMNYSQLRSAWPEIGNINWFATILDEAQYIKNPDSQTAQAARALKAEHRLALTGTPIENRLMDLWSIFAFAMPGVLGNRTHFLRRFDAKDDPLARRRLASRVRPFLLRRTKAQVARDLPDRIEEDLFCEMEGEQQTLYRAELKRAQQILLRLKSSQQLNKERFNILTSLLRLRQICCHPALVNNSLQQASAGKVETVEELLEPLMDEGHKVLIFSQFSTMLGLLREKMEEQSWPYFYLTGETENRGELVESFQAVSGAAVFLISLKAGGFGLNLTAASYVILFDPWWNPAVENQAIDRTHRIGQTSKVIAYRLLMRNSIEEKIRALQKQKAALADEILGEERFGQSLTLDDLRFLFADS